MDDREANEVQEVYEVCCRMYLIAEPSNPGYKICFDTARLADWVVSGEKVKCPISYRRLLKLAYIFWRPLPPGSNNKGARKVRTLRTFHNGLWRMFGFAAGCYTDELRRDRKA